MKNYTHENLSSSPASNDAQPLTEESEQAARELNTALNEVSSLQQSLQMLNEARFSPRKSTIEAIMQYARQNEEALH